MWVDKGNQFYNRSMKSWLQENDTEMYSTNNEGKCVVAKRFIRILKNKIYKYMTSVLKNVYIDNLDDIVNNCSNTYHNTIIDFNKENNEDDPKFEVRDHVRISKYKKNFCKMLHCKLVRRSACD